MTAVARTILVVDDDAEIAALLATFFTALGYRVIPAANGAEALAVVHTEPVDLVTSDMDMPQVTGLDLLRQLRGERPDLPVIIITGRPRLEAAVECMRIGAVDYLIKPCDLGQLRTRVEQALGAPAPRAQLPPARPAPRRRLGGYELLGPLGEGGVGLVFRARRDGREYALKVLRELIFAASNRVEMVERFAREARIAGAVKHPNVVPVLDFGTDEQEGIPFLVMPFVLGVSLDKVAEAWPGLDWRAQAHLLRQVADALGAVHAQGICHRDVKPTNILVSRGLVARLTDFGIARVPGSQLTMNLELLGTPFYMAPESFRTADVDGRADLFSLGAVAYTYLTGTLPFPGEQIATIAQAVGERLPLDPRHHRPDLPAPLVAILARLLKKDRAARYQQAAEVAADLLTFVRTGTGPAVAPTDDDWDTA